MARQSIKSVKEEVKKQDDETYGEEMIGGSEMGLEADDDTEKMVEDATGIEINEEQPVALADEVNEKLEEEE